ncbi:site-2 protease family protein [Demequina activiva]|uniref:Zinc metalloprotease n=1 Tax=Demequina activiva TaxID=1582364 RepID=A0A919Q1H6_9MICO|nr:site-2 protease family protein [Demequina activiva]GIG54457.1 peptidase M50 [Demequina activiva]
MSDAPRRTRGLQLGRAFGGRVIVQGSTLVMLVVLAFIFSTNGGQELTRRGFTIGLILAALLFVSVFLHELAHAATAKALGRQVHEVVITLWGGHTSFDAQGITPRVAGITAAAGPLANLAIAGLAWAALATGAFDLTLAEFVRQDLTAYQLIRYLMVANLILAAFNALPGIPMDGGRVLESIVWAVTKDRYRGVIVAAWGGRVVAIGVAAYAIGAPFAQGGRPGTFELIWAALIFMILWPAASSALKSAQMLRRRESVTVGTLMVPAVAIPYTATVAQAVAEASAHGAREIVVLGADGAAAGHFPVAMADAVPVEAHHDTGLQSVVMPLPRGTDVPPGLAGDDLVDALRTWWGRTDGWVVVQDGEVVGLVRLGDVMSALR